MSRPCPGSPSPTDSARSAIQVITHDDIRRSGATSIPEALRLADNLDVAQKNSHDWAISARGFNTDLGNKLLVLIDGRSVYTPLFSGVFWDVQDYLLEDIDRIEVISGPGGTLWGANAVNGVINIITKSAKTRRACTWRAAAVRICGTSPAYATAARSERMSTFASTASTSTAATKCSPIGKSASDSWRMGQGGFRIDADPSARTRLTLQGDFYGSEVQISRREGRAKAERRQRPGSMVPRTLPTART